MRDPRRRARGAVSLCSLRGRLDLARRRMGNPARSDTSGPEIASRITDASDAIVEMPSAHGREHSLEMQLPFLAHVLPGVPIVPMVMGRQTSATSFALSDAIARAVVASGRDVLLIASSDLSHYENASVAARLDGVVLDRVAAMDARRLDGRA